MVFGGIVKVSAREERDLIQNLPEEFPLKRLDDLDFGGAEAKTDNLIDNPFGFCRTLPIQEFVKGKKNIVIGERGVGKSVLFRMLSEEKIKIRKSKNEHHVILPIEEELQYGTLKDYVDKHVQTFLSDPSMKYRIVWELFILARILAFVTKKYDSSLSEELRKANEEMSVVLGYKKDPIRLLDLARGVKATVGLKIGASPIGTIEPNVYTSVEQREALSGETKPAVSEKNLDIDEYKKLIQQFLLQKNTVLFVLVDKVDEFVIKSDYDIQRLMLQALMETEKSYMDYRNIRFKLFIRCDLYKRLEYDVIGPDKVTAKKITLAWTDEDIRRFIAQRIIINYFNVMGITSLQFSIDDDKLYVDEKSIENLIPDPAHDPSAPALLSYFLRIIKRIKKELPKERKRHIEGRHTTVNDEISKQIITSVFPRQVKHMDKSGQSRQIDIFEYLSTHFSLASGTTTPRLLVMYLDKCLAVAREYYRNNPDEKVPLDMNGEYQLFKRTILKNAYAEFQKEVSESFSRISSLWKSNFERFIEKKGNRSDFTFEDLCRLLGGDREEMKSFLTFMCHIGCLKCHNPKTSYETRKYALPILFQR